jgi:hypothetical protein
MKPPVPNSTSVANLVKSTRKRERKSLLNIHRLHRRFMHGALSIAMTRRAFKRRVRSSIATLINSKQSVAYEKYHKRGCQRGRQRVSWTAKIFS